MHTYLLTVGHTHKDVDLAFGVLLAPPQKIKVLQRHRIQCPLELAPVITIGTAEWAAKRGEVCHCIVLQRIRDFAAWLEPQGVTFVAGRARGLTPHTAFHTRGGIA